MASVTDSESISGGDNDVPHFLPIVEVRPTAIGQGVFALRAFCRGEVIEEIHGRVVIDPDYSSDYCIDLGNDCSLDPDAPFRFLNHSCEPNAELFQFVDEDHSYDKRMWIHALRAIQPGEQLTIDYAWPAQVAISCRCESPKCRGWIVDPAQLQLVKDMQEPKKSRRKK